MRPIEPEELSGLMDGELSEERAAEVRAAMEADPALRAEYDRLGWLNERWMAAADTAQFEAAVQVGRGGVRWVEGALVVGAILLVRFVPKFTAAQVGMAIQVVALLVAVGFVLGLVKSIQYEYGEQ